MTNKSRRLPKAVIDTNVLVSAVIVKQGNPNRLLRSWQQGSIQLIIAPALIAEIDRILHLPRIRRKYPIAEEEVQQLIETLQAVEQVQPQQDLPIVSRDVKDNPLLAVALGGDAAYLITGDDDLLSLGGDPALGSLQIVTVRDFLIILGASI